MKHFLFNYVDIILSPTVFTIGIFTFPPCEYFFQSTEINNHYWNTHFFYHAWGNSIQCTKFTYYFSHYVDIFFQFTKKKYCLCTMRIFSSVYQWNKYTIMICLLFHYEDIFLQFTKPIHINRIGLLIFPLWG